MPDRPLNPWHGKKIPGKSRRSVAQPRSARELALEALLTFERQQVFIGKTLDQLFQDHQTDPRNRRLATELAAETLRRGSALDAVLSQYVVRPRESVEPDLWLLLQLGTCQLLCLQHIPPHAAVHETVSLCSLIGKERAKGFVNGTLRSIEREIVSVEELNSADSDNASTTPLSFQSLSSKKWPLAIPRGSGFVVRVIELARDAFADPNHPAEQLTYLSQIASQPEWLIQRWDEQIRDRNKLLQLALWFTMPGRLSLRVNLQQTNRDAVLAMLEEQELAATPGQLPESISLAGSTAISELPGFKAGHFSVQDESAMAATELLNPQPGESILDLCAAPGGKACHIAERLAGTGRVVACDVSPDRIRTIEHNIQRLKLTNIQAFALDPDGKYQPPGPFDAVLVDVPCSNTGVLGKRPEARWRLTPQDFKELVPLQHQLLNRALDLVKNGGRVVYSTCSIDPEENSELVQSVLSKRNDAELVSQTTHWPGFPADGGYQALIVRKIETC